MAKIKYFGEIVHLTGKQEESIDKQTVNLVLLQIKKMYGVEVYKICKRSFIILNGESVHLLDGYRTKIKKEDFLQFLPICGGG